MSVRLRWSVFLASVLLSALAAPEALRLVHEELARPLSRQGDPLLARDARAGKGSDETLAMRPRTRGSHNSTFKAR